MIVELTISKGEIQKLLLQHVRTKFPDLPTGTFFRFTATQNWRANAKKVPCCEIEAKLDACI